MMTQSAPTQVGFLVPKHLGLSPEHVTSDMHRIVITIRAGQNDDVEFRDAQLYRGRVRQRPARVGLFQQ
jgi:hypothetical protein